MAVGTKPHSSSSGSPQSELLFKAIFEHSPDAIAICDEERRFVVVNPTFERLFGYDTAALKGRSTAMIYAEAETFSSQGALYFNPEAMNGRELRVVRYRRRDGTTFEGETLGGPIDHPPHMQGYIGIIRDISERLEVEAAAKAAQRRLELAVEALEVGFVLYDPEDRLAVCNSQFRAMFPAIDDLIEPGRSFEELARAMLERGQFKIPRGLHEAWLEARLQDHRDPNGRPSEQALSDGRWLMLNERRAEDGCIVGIRVDVTERKRRELFMERLCEIASQRRLGLSQKIDEILRIACRHFGFRAGLVTLRENGRLQLRHCVDLGAEGDRSAEASGSPPLFGLGGLLDSLYPPLERPPSAVAAHPPRALPARRQGSPDAVVDAVVDAVAETADVGDERAEEHRCWRQPIEIAGDDAGELIFFHSSTSEPLAQSENEALLRICHRWIEHKLESQQHAEQLEETRSELMRLATLDELTGISNRRHFFERAAEAFEQARRYDKALSVLMLDIDHFKQINDRHGHQAGDRVLQHLAQIAQLTIRRADAFGRIGGEEFACALHETDLHAAMHLAERLVDRLLAGAVEVSGGTQLRFTVSVGAAELQADDGDINDLLLRADRALYTAKEGGRSRAVAA